MERNWTRRLPPIESKSVATRAITAQPPVPPSSATKTTKTTKKKAPPPPLPSSKAKATSSRSSSSKQATSKRHRSQSFSTKNEKQPKAIGARSKSFSGIIHPTAAVASSEESSADYSEAKEWDETFSESESKEESVADPDEINLIFTAPTKNIKVIKNKLDKIYAFKQSPLSNYIKSHVEKLMYNIIESTLKLTTNYSPPQRNHPLYIVLKSTTVCMPSSENRTSTPLIIWKEFEKSLPPIEIKSLNEELLRCPQPDYDFTGYYTQFSLPQNTLIFLTYMKYFSQQLAEPGNEIEARSIEPLKIFTFTKGSFHFLSILTLPKRKK